MRSLIILGVLAILTCINATSVQADEEKKPQSDLRITYSPEGDAVVTVSGPMKFVAWHFIPVILEDKEGKKIYLFMMELIAIEEENHQVRQLMKGVRSVTLKGAACMVEKCEAKTFKEHLGRTYTLVEGPDADEGEKLYVSGTFTWKKDDGDAFYFREAETKRVWKANPPKKEENK